MFKIHPITNIIDLIIVFLILMFCKNNILIFVFVLLFLFITRKHSKFSLYLIFNLFILIINISCGKLIFLGRVLTFVGYLCTIFVDYGKIDFIRVYDTLFSSANYNRTCKFLKIINYREYFVKNYNIILDTTRKIGYKNNIKYYIFCIKNACLLTNKSLDNMIYTYTVRFYFNRGRSKYKICVSFGDIFMVLFHLILLLIILIMGV